MKNGRNAANTVDDLVRDWRGMVKLYSLAVEYQKAVKGLCLSHFLPAVKFFSSILQWRLVLMYCKYSTNAHGGKLVIYSYTVTSSYRLLLVYLQ